MARTFEGRTLETLLGLVGRRDMPAYQFAGDLELCFQAFLIARRGDLHGGLPAGVEADLVEAQRLSHALCRLLQRLPMDVRRLIDLEVLSDGAYRRVAADVDDLKVPLEDFAAAIDSVLREATSKEVGIAELEDRLVAAIATAFRNRLCIEPTNAADGPFIRLLHGVLDAAKAAEPLLVPVREHLDGARVGTILAGRVVRPDPVTRLELVPESADLILPDARTEPPFVMAQ